MTVSYPCAFVCQFSPDKSRRALCNLKFANVFEANNYCFCNSMSISEANVDAFEGDIVLAEKDLQFVNLKNYGDIDGPLHAINKRAAQRARQGVWKSREIPYEIDQILSE